MRRTRKEERVQNARKFYSLLDSYKTGAVVVERCESTTNPNVNRVRFLTVVGSPSSEPLVIAETTDDGMNGCFREFFESLGCTGFVSIYDNNFSNWLYKTLHLKIVYNDRYVFVLEK